MDSPLQLECGDRQRRKTGVWGGQSGRRMTVGNVTMVGLVCWWPSEFMFLTWTHAISAYKAPTPAFQFSVALALQYKLR